MALDFIFYCEDCGIEVVSPEDHAVTYPTHTYTERMKWTGDTVDPVPDVLEDYIEDEIVIVSGTLSEHDNLDNLDYASSGHTGFSDSAHLHDDRYYTELEVDTRLDHNTIANTHNLTTDIDHDTISNTGIYNHEAIDIHIDDSTVHFTEGSIDHDALVNTHNLTTDIDHNQLTNFEINEHRSINDSGSTVTDLWSAQKINTEIVLSSGTTNHSELDELGYASSGHTGFAPTVHPHIESDITDLDKYTKVEVDGKWVTWSGTIDHDTIVNTHNLTTDIDHNTVLNNHNLTTDIDHDQLTNYAANEHFTEASIDHTNITNIGTNTHAQIDSHVADTSIHFDKFIGLEDTPSSYSDEKYLRSTTSGIEWADATGATNDIFDVYDNIGGQTFTTGTITLNLDTIRKDTGSGVFTLSIDEITITKTGTFVFIYRTSTDISTGTARSCSRAVLECDTGSGFVEVDGFRGYMYNRTLDNADSTCTVQGVIDVSVGDKFRVRLNRETGGDTIRTIVDGSGLTVFSLEGVKGDKGESGSGANIYVEDNGTSVSGSPTHTINFSGFDISTPTSGEVTVASEITVVGGDVYFVDTTRSNKKLGVAVFDIGCGRNSSNTTNQYLRTYNGTPMNQAGIPLLFNATLVGISMSEYVNTQSWYARIRRNGSTTNVYSHQLVNAYEVHSFTLDADFNEGDRIQIYLEGSSIDYPQVRTYWRRRF